MPFAREDFDSNLVSIGCVEAMLRGWSMGASAPMHWLYQRGLVGLVVLTWAGILTEARYMCGLAVAL